MADEDPNGIALRATAAFTSAGVATDAPDLTGSVGFPGDVLGALPQTSPGGLPYDVAVGPRRPGSTSCWRPRPNGACSTST